VIALAVAVIVKAVLNVVLLPIPSAGIYGAAIAGVACFFVACLIDLLYIIKRQKLKIPFFEFMVKPLVCSLVTVLTIVALGGLVFAYLPNALGALVLMGLGGLVYVAMLPVMQVFGKDESGKVLTILRLKRKKQR